MSVRALQPARAAVYRTWKNGRRDRRCPSSCCRFGRSHAARRYQPQRQRPFEPFRSRFRRADGNDLLRDEVAAPPCVGDDRELLAPESVLGRREVADGAGERLLRVEARVDAPPLRLQALHILVTPPMGVVDPPRQPPARREVDRHPEEVRLAASMTPSGVLAKRTWLSPKAAARS